MIKEQVFISKGKEAIFRHTCDEKHIECEVLIQNEEGFLFEVTLSQYSQLFYLGREYQINITMIL